MIPNVQLWQIESKFLLWPRMAIFAAAFSILSTIHAQDLAPELAPHAAKYKADVAALEAQKTATLTRLQQAYVTALDAAEKAATTAGNLDAVTAIKSERESLQNGLMAPAFPAGLPNTARPARKAYLDGAERAAADMVPKRKSVDAQYLRVLGTLEARAAGNAELAKQIVAEKENLISSPGARTVSAGGSARNVIVNGTLDAVEADGRPRGWQFYGPGAENAFKVTRDGANSVLHMVVTGAPVSIGAEQSIAIPPRAKSIVVRGRVRGKSTDHRADDSNWGADFLARCRDADGKDLSQIILIGRPEGSWKSLNGSGAIPKGAKTVNVAFVGWWVAGTFDFDDFELEFR